MKTNTAQNTVDLTLTPKKVGLQLKVILRHKYYVAKACFKAGYPLKAITHDMSKFSPTELLDLARGQGYGKSPVVVIKEAEGQCVAWQHHKGHNPHHWEYWIDKLSSRKNVALKMPFNYAAELFCDYIGVGQSYNPEGWTPESAREYWVEMKNHSIFHPDTYELVDSWFTDLVEKGEDWTLRTLKLSKEAYERRGK